MVAMVVVVELLLGFGVAVLVVVVKLGLGDTLKVVCLVAQYILEYHKELAT